MYSNRKWMRGYVVGAGGVKGKDDKGAWGGFGEWWMCYLDCGDSQVMGLSSLDGSGLAEKGIGSQVAGHVHSTWMEMSHPAWLP